MRNFLSKLGHQFIIRSAESLVVEQFQTFKNYKRTYKFATSRLEIVGYS